VIQLYYPAYFVPTTRQTNHTSKVAYALREGDGNGRRLTKRKSRRLWLESRRVDASRRFYFSAEKIDHLP
jgi:hypothetical protein